MNINLKSIGNIAKYAPHRVYAVLLVGAAVLIPSIAILATGPDRPTYTIEQPADHITFNSITNNPEYGDERSFMTVKDAENTAAGGWRGETTVVPGKEYLVRMYVHNNAGENLNLVAENVRASANVPTTTGKALQIDGYITSSNASPQQIVDQVVLRSDQDFNATYEPGSARLYNNAFGQTGAQLADSIVTNAGAPLGYTQLDGKIPGCFKYSGILTFKIKVQGVNSDFAIEKKVRKHGETAWQKSIAANPGETVDYQIGYTNTGQIQQNNVVAKDTLPTSVGYLDNTTTLKNASNPTGDGLKLASNEIAKPTGVNIGNYTPGSNAFIRFSAKLPEEKDLPQCGNNVLRNTAYIQTGTGTKQDVADVTVNKKCVDQASYSCDALQATKIAPLEYSFNVNLSQNKATAKEVTIDFGDGQTATRDAKSLPVTHTYAQAGQYTIKVTASFDVNGKTVKDVTSDACQAVINTETTPPATVTGTTPTSLPSTGPVEVFTGIIAAAALGLGVQQWIASRRSVASAIHHQ